MGNLFELEDLGAQDLNGIAGPVRAGADLHRLAGITDDVACTIVGRLGLQHPRLTRIQATNTGGVRACIRRVGFAGQTGAQANPKLTFHPDHSMGAAHSGTGRISGSGLCRASKNNGNNCCVSRRTSRGCFRSGRTSLQASGAGFWLYRSGFRALGRCSHA